MERDGKVYPFALNIDLKCDADAEKRIPIGRDCLKALGKLKRRHIERITALRLSLTIESSTGA